MAYRAYHPTKPPFRKVKKLKGRNLDNVTRDMMKTYNHNPWESIYVKEICTPSDQQGRKGPMIATHSGHESVISQRAKNRRAKKQPNGQNGAFDNLNDNVSVRSFKTRSRQGGNRKRDKDFDNMFAANPGRTQQKKKNFGSSSLLKKTGGASIARNLPSKGENYEDYMKMGEDNPYLEGHLAIDDSEFYREGFEDGKPKSETLVEKNIYDILMSNPDFRSKCLKAGYPMQKNSVYKKDYVPMGSHKDPALNPKIDFKPDNPMDLGTIHKSDFIRPAKFNVVEPSPGDTAKKRGLDDGAEHLKAPINKHTNYNLDYPDWGAIPQSGLLQPTNPKTHAVGMPFYDRQTYKDYGNFKKQPDPRKFNPEKGQKNPLGVDLPFIGDTSYGSYYRPFKVGPGSKGPELDKVSDKMPNYDGQYKTTYQDFDGRSNKNNPKSKGCNCIVTPDQKVCMVNDTTKSILANASPELSRAILGDIMDHARNAGKLDGEDIYDARDYTPEDGY